MKKVNESIVYNDLTISNFYVYVINTKDYFITENSIIKIDGNFTNTKLFKIGNDLVFETNFTKEALGNPTIINEYKFYLDNLGNYSNDSVYLDLYDENPDIVMSYLYYNKNNQQKILSVDNLVGNSLKLDDVDSLEVNIIQLITYKTNIFIPYKYHLKVVINNNSNNLNILEKSLGTIQTTDRIYELPFTFNELREYSTNKNIKYKDGIIENIEVISIETDNINFYVPLSDIYEYNNFSYFKYEQDLTNGRFWHLWEGPVVVTKIESKNNFYVKSVEENKIIVYTDLGVLLPNVNYLFITKSLLNLRNLTYGETELIYEEKNTIVEEKLESKEIIPNKFEIFNYIKILIDNNVIVNLDTDIYKTIYNYHFSESKKKQFDELTKIRDRILLLNDVTCVVLFLWSTKFILPLAALINLRLNYLEK